MADTLSQYLMQRGLVLEPEHIQAADDPVLSDENLLAEASELWRGHERLITLVVQARVNAIARQILEKCVPQETIVLRQSLVEVGAILDDFVKYQREQERRKAAKEPEENQPEEVPPSTTSNGEQSM